MRESGCSLISPMRRGKRVGGETRTGEQVDDYIQGMNSEDEKVPGSEVYPIKDRRPNRNQSSAKLNATTGGSSDVVAPRFFPPRPHFRQKKGKIRQSIPVTKKKVFVAFTDLCGSVGGGRSSRRSKVHRCTTSRSLICSSVSSVGRFCSQQVGQESNVHHRAAGRGGGQHAHLRAA